MMAHNQKKQAIEILRKHGGPLSTSQAARLGIAPYTLYALRQAGLVLRESRGVYRLAETLPGSHADLAHVALRVPKGIVCLISALVFHDLTTQIPHQVYLALPNQAEKPRLAYPPLRLIWLSPQVYSAGIEEHQVEGVRVRVYGIEKTIADCFKFRQKIGLDVALEALKDGLNKKRCSIDGLLHFAQIDRVTQVMRPYMEALV